MLLMTDVLLFLQEKDQKYIFPALVSSSSPSLATDRAHRPFFLSYSGRNPPEPDSQDCNYYYSTVRSKNS